MTFHFMAVPLSWERIQHDEAAESGRDNQTGQDVFSCLISCSMREAFNWPDTSCETTDFVKQPALESGGLRRLLVRLVSDEVVQFVTAMRAELVRMPCNITETSELNGLSRMVRALLHTC